MTPRESARGREPRRATDRITPGGGKLSIFSGKFDPLRTGIVGRNVDARVALLVRVPRHLQLGGESVATPHPPCVSDVSDVSDVSALVRELMLSSARPMGNFGLCHGNFSLRPK